MNKYEVGTNIVVYQNVLKNPEYVLELISDFSEDWEPGGVASSRYKDYNSSELIRDVFVKYVPFNESEAVDEKVRAVSKILNESFDKCESDYLSFVNITVSSHEGYQVVKYNAGQYFKDHIDATEEFPRKLSSVYYFNDDYEGGEIYFSNLNVTVKPEKNSLIVFPSSDLHRHSANPIITGTKYAIVGFWQ